MAVSARSFFDPGVALTSRQERDFFKSIRLSSGVFKTTEDARLDDFNGVLVDALVRSGAQPRHVLDVGASSGVTSVELIDVLSAAGFDATLTATDVSLFGSLVGLSRNHYVLTDRSGEILQHMVFGLALRPWPRRMDAFTGYWLVRRIANRTARAALARDRSGEAVMLVSERARAHPRVRFVEDDILTEPAAELSGRFNLVRAANVLNRNYFGKAELERAVAGIKRRMGPAGSVLAVVRTLEDGTNHGTVFRLNENGGFEILSRLGKGSEIEEIVLASDGDRRGRRN